MVKTLKLALQPHFRREPSLPTTLTARLTYDPNGQFEHLDAFAADNPDSVQRDNFTITISEGQGDTQTLTVEMIVQGENDAPTVSITLADPAPTTASTEGTLVAIAEGSDIDTNGESGLRYAFTGTVSGAFEIDEFTGEIRILDEFQYQNPPGGEHVINVQVNDADGGESITTYTIPIVDMFDRPD